MESFTRLETRGSSGYYGVQHVSKSVPKDYAKDCFSQIRKFYVKVGF